MPPYDNNRYLAGVPSGDGVNSRGVTSAFTIAGSTTSNGQWEKNDYEHIGISFKADQDCTLTLSFGMGPESSETTVTQLSFSVLADTSFFAPFVKLPGRKAKVDIENLSGSPASVVCLVSYGNNLFPAASALNSTFRLDAPALLTRSVPTDLDLAFGRIGGLTEDGKFGFVPNLTNVSFDPTDIWAFGGTGLTKTFPSSASTFYLASDSTSDTDVDVTVEYLDATGALQTVTVNTNGQSSVSLGVTALDCNRAYVSNENLNVGNIAIITADNFSSGSPATPAQVVAYIPAGFGQTQQATYTVPLGYSMRIKRAIVYLARSSGAAGSATIHLRAKLPGEAWRVKRPWQVTTSVPVNKPVSGLVFPELTQVTMRVFDVSDSGSNFTGEWHYDLVATG